MTIAKKKLRGDVMKVFSVEMLGDTQRLIVMRPVHVPGGLGEMEYRINQNGGLQLPARRGRRKFFVQTIVVHNQEF